MENSRKLGVIGDLHGRLEALYHNLIALGAITGTEEEFNRQDFTWTRRIDDLVLLGDIFADRFDEGVQIVNTILALKEKIKAVNGTVSIIAGNHEDFAISMLTKTASGSDNYDRIKELCEMRDFGGGLRQALSSEDPDGKNKIKDHKQSLLSFDIAKQIGDVLLIHTPPTAGLAKALLACPDIAQINDFFRGYLRHLFQDGQPVPAIPSNYLAAEITPTNYFQDLREAFLDTENRHSFFREGEVRELLINKGGAREITTMGGLRRTGQYEITSKAVLEKIVSGQEANYKESTSILEALGIRKVVYGHAKHQPITLSIQRTLTEKYGLDFFPIDQYFGRQGPIKKTDPRSVAEFDLSPADEPTETRKQAARIKFKTHWDDIARQKRESEKQKEQKKRQEEIDKGKREKKAAISELERSIEARLREYTSNVASNAYKNFTGNAPASRGLAGWIRDAQTGRIDPSFYNLFQDVARRSLLKFYAEREAMIPDCSEVAQKEIAEFRAQYAYLLAGPKDPKK